MLNSRCLPWAQSTGDAVVPAFRDFVSGEKQRLAQKKQAVFKAERDKWTADFVKFSQTFKVSPSSTLLIDIGLIKPLIAAQKAHPGRSRSHLDQG